MSDSSSPSIKSIEKDISRWRSQCASAWARGEDAISFVEMGEQWDPNVESSRALKNKATITCNLLIKTLRTVQGQGKNIELSLDLQPTNDAWAARIEETKTFRLLLNHIMLREENKRVFSGSLDKVYSYGCSVLFSNVKQENQKTLNKGVFVSRISDPSRAFFDLSSQDPTFNQGQFCGLMTELTKKQLLRTYPKFKDASWIKGKNTLVDYWYKDKKEANFIKLVTGVFIREDLMSRTDVAVKKDGEQVTQKGFTTVIKHKRFVKGTDMVIDPDKEWPADDLPLVYEYGLTVWTKKGPEAFPFCYHLYGTQQLHNMAASQIATSIKNATGDKWIGTKENIQDDDAKKYAKKINQVEGFIPFTSDSEGRLPQRAEPSLLSPGLPQVYESSKQEVNDIIGAYTEENSMLKAHSGVALDKMFNRQDILQNNVVSAHFHAIDVLGHVIQGMIPKVYTEQRELVVDSQDGQIKTISINVFNPSTLKISNSIKDLQSNYHYKLTSSVSTDLLKQNTLFALQKIIETEPKMAQYIMDIYMKCLDSPYSEELSRRMITVVNPMVVKYSQGDLTQQEFQQQMQQQQQEAQQHQIQQMQNSPQMQKIQADKERNQQKTYIEQLEAQIKQFEAMTARFKEISAAHKSQLGIASDNYNAAQDRQLQHFKAEMQTHDDAMKVYGQ